MPARIRSVPVNDIVVRKRRTIDTEKLAQLVESIRTIGLKTPISVRFVHGKKILLTGAYRLAAAKLLQHDNIDVVVVPRKRESQLWKIAENLHRAELTALERSELIEQWRIHVHGEGQDAQVARPGGRQPTDLGIAKTAKSLGVPPDEVRRSKAIAALSPKARKTAVKLGLEDNQSALLAAAKESGAKEGSLA